jgi:hypothetical protein
VTATIFTVNGTGADPDDPTGTGFAAAVGAGVNQTFYDWVPITYTADLPLLTSYQSGVALLAQNIAELADGSNYVLVGYDQGAMVVSQILNSVAAGLVGQGCNLLAGVTFGSPMREESSTFPGDKSGATGEGIMSSQYLLTNTPTWWWDFAIPTDIIPCGGDPTYGSVATTIFMDLYATWEGDLPTLLTLIDEYPAWTSELWAIAGIVQGNISTAIPHGQYGTYKPVTGSTKTCVAWAIAYLNGLALLYGTGNLTATGRIKGLHTAGPLAGHGALTCHAAAKAKNPAALAGHGALTGFDYTYHLSAAANLTGQGVLYCSEP